MDNPSTSAVKQEPTTPQRRNTRSSSSTCDKKDEASGSETSTIEGSKKRLAQNKTIKGENGEIVSYKTDDDIVYTVGDCAYLLSERSETPYHICSIQELRVNKRDSGVVVVKWYYRTLEVPDCVYQILMKERVNENDGNVDENKLLANCELVNRELFISDSDVTDTYPISHLRGKCNVQHLNSFKEAQKFNMSPDNFFCVLSYNPETRRLASSLGETRVGPSHQWTASMRGLFQKADIPEIVTDESMPRYNETIKFEEMTWAPNVNDGDLINCLRTARNMAAFAEMYDGVSAEEGCMVASRDDTTINTLRILFKNDGDACKAVEELIKNPIPVTIDSKWTEEEVKDVVEFYYLWKKRPNGLFIRPQTSKAKRQTPIKKGQKSSSASSTEDDSAKLETSDFISYKCKTCNIEITESTKECNSLCSRCQINYKKYGNAATLARIQKSIFEIANTNGLHKGLMDTLANQVCPPSQDNFVYTALKDDKPSEPKQDPTPGDDDASNAATKRPNKRLWNDSEAPAPENVPSCSGLKRHKTEERKTPDAEKPEKPLSSDEVPQPFINRGQFLLYPKLPDAVSDASTTHSSPYAVPANEQKLSTGSGTSATQTNATVVSATPSAMATDTNPISVTNVQPSVSSPLRTSSMQSVTHSQPVTIPVPGIHPSIIPPQPRPLPVHPAVVPIYTPSVTSQSVAKVLHPNMVSTKPASAPSDTYNPLHATSKSSRGNTPFSVSSHSSAQSDKPLHLLPPSNKVNIHHKYSIGTAVSKYGAPPTTQPGYLTGPMYVGGAGSLHVSTFYTVGGTTQTSGSTQVTAGTFYPAAPTSGSTPTTNTTSNVASVQPKQNSNSPVKQQVHPKKDKQRLAVQQLTESPAVSQALRPSASKPHEVTSKSIHPRKEKLLAPISQADESTSKTSNVPPVSNPYMMPDVNPQMYRYPIPYPPGMPSNLPFYTHMAGQMRFPPGLIPGTSSLQATTSVVTTVTSAVASSVPSLHPPKHEVDKHPTAPSSREQHSEKENYQRGTEPKQGDLNKSYHHHRSDSFSKSRVVEPMYKPEPRRMSEEHRPISKVIKTEHGVPRTSSEPQKNPYLMTPTHPISPRTDNREASQNPTKHSYPYFKTENTDHPSSETNKFPFGNYNDPYHSRLPPKPTIKHEVPTPYNQSEASKPNKDVQLLHAPLQSRNARHSPHSHISMKDRHTVASPGLQQRGGNYPHQRPHPHSSPHSALKHHHASPSPVVPRTTNLPRPVTSQDEAEQRSVPSPPPTRCNIICTPTQQGKARFNKVWDRGENSCSRTDLVFYPKPASKPTTQKTPSQPSTTQKHQRTPSTHSIVSEPERKRDKLPVESQVPVRRELPRNSPHHRVPSVHSTPQATPVQPTPTHVTVARSTPAKTPTAYDHRVPVSIVSPYTLGADTPAIRTLRQYASYDIQRNEAISAMMAQNPLYPYYQQADRERDLREIESRERLSKHAMDGKPPDIIDPRAAHLLPGMGAIPNLPGAPGIPTSIPGAEGMVFDPLRHTFPGGILGGFGPGNPANPSIAAAMSGFPQPGGAPGFPLMPVMRPGMDLASYGMIDRMANESLQAERLAAERYQMELLHHHHQHSHVHSHLHLHQQPQIPGAPPHPGHTPGGPILPPPGALGMQDPLLNPLMAAASLEQLQAMAATNPMLAASLRTPSTAALMQHQAHAAMNLHAIAGREATPHPLSATPHPLSATQHLQAVHEQHLLESTQRARAFDPMTRFTAHKP